MEEQATDKSSSKTGPKRPMSAYNFFFKMEKTKWLNENKKGVLDDGQSGSRFKAMTNAVSSKWKTLTDDEKVPFVKMAEQAMKEYRENKSAFNEKTLEESKLLQATRKRRAEEEHASQGKSPKQMHSTQTQPVSMFASSGHAASPLLPLSSSTVGFTSGMQRQVVHPENAARLLPFLSAAYPQQHDPFSRIRFHSQQNVAMPPFLPNPDIDHSFLSQSLLQNAAATSQAALLLRINAMEEQAYRRQLIENMQLLQSRQELELANRLRGNNIWNQLLANSVSDAEMRLRGNDASILEQLLENSATDPSSSTDASRKP